MTIDPNDIQLSPEHRRCIAERAERTGKPWSELLDELFPSSNSKPGKVGESALEVAKRLGIVGATEGDATDLATNPAYMEGFGESDFSTRSD